MLRTRLLEVMVVVEWRWMEYKCEMVRSAPFLRDRMGDTLLFMTLYSCNRNNSSVRRMKLLSRARSDDALHNSHTLSESDVEVCLSLPVQVDSEDSTLEGHH
jgi:hypothetical protein